MTLTPQPLKVSTLRADKAAAEQLTSSLLDLVTKTGKKPFRRIETETGWQVTMPFKIEEGKIERHPIFEYKELPIGKQVMYDPRFVKI